MDPEFFFLVFLRKNKLKERTMKYKDKFLVQTVTCITIIAMINGGVMVKNDKISEIKDKVKLEINKDYTYNELIEIRDNVLSLPDNFNRVIMTANQLTDTSKPIDEFSDEKIKVVRSSTGGEVIYAGIDKDVGICIRIENANKIYTYGNLSSINVITGERVIKSEAIGTYDSESNKEFYYQVEDNMV